MKRISSIAAILACTVFTQANAAQDLGDHFPGEISANVTLASDYVFRGLSQTSEQPAIQGGFDYNADISEGVGLYLGTWASNVNYADGDEASIEIDYYGGITYEVQNIGIDLGAIYYTYPGAEGNFDYDFLELQAALTYAFGGASITGSINYSPDYYAVNTDDAFYYKLGTEIPLPTPYGISLDAHLGHQTVDLAMNGAGLVDNVTDWSVGLNVPFKTLDFRVSYTDTNLDDADCVGFPGTGVTGACDGRAVFSVSKSF